MGKKLEKNGLWESSRMVLPEHREQMIQRLANMNKAARPKLAEQVTDQLRGKFKNR